MLKVRDMRLPEGEYVLFGSAPLYVRGVIPACNDLDVLCRGAAWTRAQQYGELVRLDKYDLDIVTLDDGAISFGTTWGIGDIDVDEVIDAAEIIEGLPFAPLRYVIRYKQIRNSDKDREHLQRLRAR